MAPLVFFSPDFGLIVRVRLNLFPDGFCRPLFSSPIFALPNGGGRSALPVLEACARGCLCQGGGSPFPGL